MFTYPLEKILDPGHSLVILSERIDWAEFDDLVDECYWEKGRPGCATRLMIGSLYLTGYASYDAIVCGASDEGCYRGHPSVRRLRCTKSGENRTVRRLLPQRAVGRPVVPAGKRREKNGPRYPWLGPHPTSFPKP